MKKKVGLVALIIISLNFISCSSESTSEEDSLYIVATEGDDGEVEEGRDGQ